MSRFAIAVMALAGALVFAPQPAAAYIGPGAGITMLGALWGVVLAVAMALGAILFWPIRALLRKRRPATPPAGAVTRDKVS